MFTNQHKTLRYASPFVTNVLNLVASRRRELIINLSLYNVTEEIFTTSSFSIRTKKTEKYHPGALRRAASFRRHDAF